MESRSDEELIAEYRAAPSPAEARLILDELFHRLLSRVALWCYRLTGDREWAADLTQEVLMKVFRSLESFRGDSKFSTWVYSITRNHCFNEIRSRPAATVGMEPEMLESVAGQGEDPYALLARESSAVAVNKLLQETLTEPEIQVMKLHYGEELPLDAITRLLGLRNASGAKAYIVSAQRKLRTATQRWMARAKAERP